MGDFAGQIAIQEWWSGFGFWLLVTGLVGEIVVLATIIEIRELREEGQSIKWHQFATLVGGALVAIFVGVEYQAESKSAHLETKLRDNNASAQAVLVARERDATAHAVAIAKSFGGASEMRLSFLATARLAASVS